MYEVEGEHVTHGHQVLNCNLQVLTVTLNLNDIGVRLVFDWVEFIGVDDFVDHLNFVRVFKSDVKFHELAGV